MASIKVILYTSKTLSNGEHPIMLRVIKDRKTKYISLGLNCAKTLWNFKENLPQKKHPLYSRIVNKINKEKLKASKMLIDLENENLELSADQLKSKLKSEIKNKKTVFQYFDELIANFEKAKRIGYANIFKSTKNSLLNFKNDPQLPFSEITPSFIMKYEELTRLNVNLIGKALTFLAYKKGSQTDPNKKYSIKGYYIEKRF